MRAENTEETSTREQKSLRRTPENRKVQGEQKFEENTREQNSPRTTEDRKVLRRAIENRKN